MRHPKSNLLMNSFKVGFGIVYGLYYTPLARLQEVKTFCFSNFPRSNYPRSHNKRTCMCRFFYYGGVGGLSAPLVWCVESFFEGLAKCNFEASGSGWDFQNETNETQKDPLSPCLNYVKMGKVRAYLRYE